MDPDFLDDLPPRDGDFTVSKNYSETEATLARLGSLATVPCVQVLPLAMTMQAWKAKSGKLALTDGNRPNVQRGSSTLMLTNSTCDTPPSKRRTLCLQDGPASSSPTSSPYSAAASVAVASPGLHDVEEFGTEQEKKAKEAKEMCEEDAEEAKEMCDEDAEEAFATE